VFIMATTELHKVPDTILSRTQEFEFRTIPQQKILDRLKLIAETEKIDIADEALREIARSGDGSMRDAQSNFDQVISFAGERIEVEDITAALGLASVDMLTRMLDAIAENEPTAILAVVEELSARGHDFRNFCRDLLGLLRDLLVTRVGGDPSLCETSMLSAAKLEERARPFSESDLVRFFHSLAETEAALKDATQPRFILEVGLVKLVEMRRLAPLESILERLARLELSLNGLASTPLAAAAPEDKLPPPSKEKKTLKTESPAISRGYAVEPVVDRPAVKLEPVAHQIVDVEYLRSMPVRLPPIPSEELEHVEDQWLDDAYERKLVWSGDDLAPFSDAGSLLDGLSLGPQNGGHAFTVSSGGPSGSAAAALALAEVEEPGLTEDYEMPGLSEYPSDEELRAYAQAHPALRAALKVFRGRITSVTLKQPKS
jgi:DNA polymerase III gamma/tau subunit